jgi:hypothetical protein
VLLLDGSQPSGRFFEHLFSALALAKAVMAFRVLALSNFLVVDMNALTVFRWKV